MKASFNGSEHEFHIKREHVTYLEHTLGRGLYDVLKDFTAGRWTFADVATLISFALHGPTHADRQAISLANHAVRCGMPVQYSSHYRPHPGVVSTFERDGHGNFAELAADILTQTIFGDTHSGNPNEAA